MAEFPPLLSDVTTDDVTDPIGWTIVMSLIVLSFSILQFSWCSRTISNIFSNEYFRKESNGNFLKGGNGRWMQFWIWPAFSFSLSLMFYIWTWVAYANKLEEANGDFITPRDTFAVTITTVCLLLIIIWSVLIFVDLYQKYELVSNQDAKIVNILQTLSTHGDSATKYGGMNANTTVINRWIIWMFNLVIWGNITTLLGTFVLTWDRAIFNNINQPANTYHLDDYQIWFTFWNGIVLYLTLIYPVLRNMCSDSYESPLWKFYNNDSDSSDVDSTYGHSANIHPEHRHRIQEMVVGFSSDTIGHKGGFKGQIPVHNLPFIYMIARVMFIFSVGFGIYNDQRQALALFVIVGLLPLTISLFTKTNNYYVVYETLAFFWFYVLSYFSQSVLFYGNDAESYNYNLMTVNQDVPPSIVIPREDYGTSIKLVYGADRKSVV